ncbi:MAG: hypothetical protein NVSMB25_13940 [Thermoleophilaceae bacterium]
MAQIHARFPISRRLLHKRLGALAAHHYVTSEHVFHGEGCVYRATPRALRLARLPARDRREADLSRHHHDLATVWATIELEREFGSGRLLTGRELSARRAGYAIRPAERARRHLPDLVVGRRGEQRPLFVEVEQRTRGRALDRILLAYLARAEVGGVRLYASTEGCERWLRAACERVEAPEGLVEIRRVPWPDGIPPERARDRSSASMPIAARGRTTSQRLTARDEELVRWVGRQGIATATQIGEHIGMAINGVHVRTRMLIRRGLLVHDRVRHLQPGVYRATSAGLSMVDLPLRPAALDLARFQHSADLVTLCLALEREFGAERVVTERELRFSEACLPEQRYSAIVGRYGGARRHYPDLAVERYDGERPLAVELERSLKTRFTLDRILAAYVGAHHVAGVRYYAASNEVERALRGALVRVAAPNGLIEIRRWPSAAVGAQ